MIDEDYDIEDIKRIERTQIYVCQAIILLTAGFMVILMYLL